MNIRNNYKHTIYACYIGYITQAIVNNFAPLLFLTFQSTFKLSLSMVGLLVTINFGTQLITDLIAAKVVDKIGYRCSMIVGHICAALGLVGIGVFPGLFENPYVGLCLAVILYAIGGGVNEVLVSPIVEACPTDDKVAAMSLLHSFYCWGSVLVVLLSTVLFKTVGIDNWRMISCLWALVPLFNVFYFSFVPINTLVEEDERMSIKQLMSSKIFWVLALLMVCSGASELAMSQWASAFAESGLKVSKTIGDLAGPCLFAVLMGSSRVLHSKLADKISLYRYLGASAVLCIISYLMATFSPWPVLSLFGCGLCGVSVAAMWPGTFSLASEKCPKGGTAMFAFLALAGDLGCSSGPTMVGYVSAAFGDDLKKGLCLAVVFPVILIVGLILCKRVTRTEK